MADTEPMPGGLEAYIAWAMAAPDPDMLRLEREAAGARVPIVGRATGALLELLCRLVRPRLIVELGTAAGYSGLWLLRGWPAARLVTFEVDSILADQARRTFAAAGLASRVTVREENAVEGLETIRRGSAGLVFNDVLNGLRDEARVEDCFRLACQALRRGGLLLADNALEAGEVLRPESREARCVHRWNQLVRNEPSLTCLILRVGDGLSVAVRS